MPVWAICSMLLLGGCSSDDLDLITDYGNNDVTVALAEGTVQVDDSSMDGDSDSAILGHDLFGSGKIEWKDNFITDDGSVKVDIDVDFNRVDVKKQQYYPRRRDCKESFWRYSRKAYGGKAFTGKRGLL